MSARTRPSLRVRRALTPRRIQVSSRFTSLVEPGILRRFDLEELLLAADVAPVVAGKGDQPAPVDLQDTRRQALQEGPVVGDEKHRLHEAQEELLHPEDGVDVQVVRRLVQEQDVGIARQRPRQGDPPFESGGERRAGGPFVETHAGDDRPDPLLLVGRGGMARLPVGHAIVDGSLQGGGDLLGQQGGLEARCPDHRTAVGRQIAVDQLQQGGLARAVAADQADPLPAFDLHLHPVENRFAAEAEAYPLQGYQRHRVVLTPRREKVRRAAGYGPRRRLDPRGGRRPEPPR